ncbi:MAG: VOC family protein [Nitrospirota bacterium]|nr:VOC family protein [Nitrospirota bacterium]
MVFDHTGIISKSEEEAVRFYQGLLGLEKIKESVVAAGLCQQLFSVSEDIKMLVFGKGNIKVEIFIIPDWNPSTPNIPHFCIQVPDLPEFIEKTKAAGARVIKGSYNEKTVYFIEDFSGNRIEIKPL